MGIDVSYLRSVDSDDGSESDGYDDVSTDRIRSVILHSVSASSLPLSENFRMGYTRQRLPKVGSERVHRHVQDALAFATSIGHVALKEEVLKDPTLTDPKFLLPGGIIHNLLHPLYDFKP